MSSSPAILLETERMQLRQFHAGDAVLLLELDSDPEVMRFITKGRATPLAKIQEEILPRFLEFYRHTPPRGFWAAHLRETKEFIGWFHLRPDKISPAEMELGYRLRRSAWGRGLASEGSRALIKKAFGEWGHEKVSAHTMALNLASRRVMEKAGLRFDHEFFYPADVASDWIKEEERRAVKYSLTREDFNRLRR
jgi:RimJ/RimL family protein N-acetyltransferase